MTALAAVVLALTRTASHAQAKTNVGQGCLHGVKRFDIESGDARDRLNVFARQSDVQLLFDFSDAQGFTSPDMHGEYEVGEALSILLHNIPIKYECVNDSTLALVLTSGCPKSLRSFHIPGGPLTESLMEFSRRS